MKFFAVVACIAANCAIWVPARAQDIVWVGDERFQLTAEGCFQLDDNDESWRVVPGIICVRFDGSIDSTLAPAALSDLSMTLLYPRPDIGGYYRYSYDTSVSPPSILEATSSASHVIAAYLDTELKFYGDPDPYFVNQWNLTKTRVDKAWEITKGNSGLTIAVLDNGFQVDHEDLVESLWTNEIEANGDPGEDDDGNGYVDDVHGWDFVSGDNNVEPVTSDGRHGTAVAGIVSAALRNGKGIAGVAGGNAGDRPKLLMLRIYTMSNVAPAIEYAWRAGARIINWSGGGYGNAGGAGDAAIDSVCANGALFFGAIGNISTPSTQFPCTNPNVIAVGATNESDERLCQSAYGPDLDIMGPSASNSCLTSPIWTTDGDGVAFDYNPGQSGCGFACASIPPDNPKYFGKFVGTSAACPLVAGVGGLIMTHFAGLTSDQLRGRLLSSAIDLGSPGRDDDYGYGRVDAYRALTEWGTITGNVTWSPSDSHDGARYVSGDLTIAQGATLTIMPGTIIKVAEDDDLGAGDDPDHVEIIVQGSLVADATTASPILFRSWKSTTSPNWAGIRFEAGSTGTLDNCRIKHALLGIGSSADLTITNTVIDSCLTGLRCSDGAMIVQDCDFSNNETAVASHSSLSLLETNISDCTNAAVLAIAGDALISGCLLNEPGDFGIDVQGGSVTVRHTTVDGALMNALSAAAGTSLVVRSSIFMNSDTGLFVNGNASVDVASVCYFYQCNDGVHLNQAGSSISIKNCGIAQNANSAIACDNSSHAVIDSNIIANNGSGIYCSNGSSPVITENEFQATGFAITAVSGANPDVGHLTPSLGQSPGFNKIAHTGKYVVNYNSGIEISAENNCWNKSTTPCDPASNMFTGSVDYTDPICCEFPRYTGGEGEPFPTEGFAFNADPQNPAGPAQGARAALTAIVPNPFNPNTTVCYSLAEPGTVQIRVYDVAGRLVRELVSRSQPAGPYSVVWDGTDGRASVASGVYFVRMSAAGQVFVKKALLLK